jgi:adiponectin receptor
MDTSPLYALASLRFLVLSHLADLEHRLTQFEFEFDFDFDLDLDFESRSKALEGLKLQGEHKFREAKARARVGIEMLERIRADVCSHFPDLPMSPSLEGLANFKSRLPDVSSLEDLRSNIPDIRSHFPDVPPLPDMSLPESVRSRLPDMSLSETMRAHLPGVNMHMRMPTLPDLHIRDFHTGMDDVLSEMRHKLLEIDFRKPFKYIPTLSQSLENLHYHLSSMSSIDAVPSGLPNSPTFEFTPNTVLSDFLEYLSKSDIVKGMLDSAPEAIRESEEILERAAIEVSDALTRSVRGMRLINYSDLPHPWRNNPFVTYGYRFVLSSNSVHCLSF